MVNQNTGLFRKQALERSSSPEQLDRIMTVVSPKNWLPIAAFTSLVISGLAWSIVGRIPITVEGQGVMIHPNQVTDIQVSNSGVIKEWYTQVGDVVKKGQVLGIIDQSELQKQLQQQNLKLLQLKEQDSSVSSLAGQGVERERRAIQQQRENAQQRIDELQTLTPTLKTRNREALKKERQQLEQRLTQVQELAPTIKKRSRESLSQQSQSLQERIQAAKAQLPFLKKRVSNFKSLVEQKVVSEAEYFRVQEEYLKRAEEIAQMETQLREVKVREGDTQEKFINSDDEIASIRARLQKLQVEETNAEQAYLVNINEIARLRAELRELDTREANLAKQNLQDATIRKNEIQEVSREIDKLELQLRNNSQITSQQEGRILEIAVKPGQVVNAGTRLGSIDAAKDSSKMVAITYFPVADGKKIQSGMKMQITPQTIQRERFGGILSKVTNVSTFPIAKEGAASIVGNAEIVQSLIAQGPHIQVFAELQTDSSTFSGYRWSSSKGPQMKISPGTTTSVRVTVEERAPITFVFPILKSWSGAN
jgi:HlyD family secretion protein